MLIKALALLVIPLVALVSFFACATLASVLDMWGKSELAAIVSFAAFTNAGILFRYMYLVYKEEM